MTEYVADYQEMLAALCLIEDGLSDWEADFVDDMTKKFEKISGADRAERHFTEKQLQKIVELYDEHC